MVDGLGSHLLTNVVDGLLVGRHRHRQTHCRHRGGERGGGRGLRPHCFGGCRLMLLRWRALTGSQREDRLVEARHRAAHCVHPCRQMIVIWSRPAACFAGVGVGNVPTVRGTIIQFLKRLNGVGGWIGCCPAIVGGWYTSA